MDENYTLLDVSEREKFITNYKAVYQAMTAKHDCKSKIFPRNVKVTLSDILELNERITEKLRNHNDAGFTISVTVSFSGKQTIEFSSWGEFESHNWNESNAINSITIIWEFNALLPQYEVPQKHVVVVKIADGLRPEEMLNIVFAGKLENIEDIEKQMYPVVARVDFINYVLGDELLHIVEEWNEGLELQDGSSYLFSDFPRKHKRKIAYVLNYTTNMVAIVCILKIIVHLLKSYSVKNVSELTIDNVCEILWLIGILSVAFVFVDKVAGWLANIFYQNLGQERVRHVFFLNKGDQKLQKKIEKEQEKSKRMTVGSVFGTFLINLLCTIICSLIV